MVHIKIASGGGLNGLTLALALARGPLHVTVIDTRPAEAGRPQMIDLFDY